ncbi:hypothetical protein RHMOL_Rhmol01G0073800 [Rhododendron molle]|uniref:Uncharacterized protein n=1 Tax=Rhododendron molle TaxID=49168 RepID=A0ACC0PYR2_RHOML|nr:hypothetical protein RHMOL_Rhmol01G0073800 [Rhododendron molle]
MRNQTLFLSGDSLALSSDQIKDSKLNFDHRRRFASTRRRQRCKYYDDPKRGWTACAVGSRQRSIHPPFLTESRSRATFDEKRNWACKGLCFPTA